MSLPARADQRALAAAFVEIAVTPAAGYTVPTLLRLLCRQCVQLLEIAAAGVVLTDKDGRFEVAATCNVHPQIVLPRDGDEGQGPVVECVRTGTPVTVSDLTSAEQVWPGFAARACKQGLAWVHAVPMRSWETHLGALALFGTRAGELALDEADLAQSLIDVAMASVVQQRSLEQTRAYARQLQGALDSRVVIEQAKGALAQRGGIDVDEAFLVLRRYARSHQQSLRQLAAELLVNNDLADKILNSDTSGTDSSG